jgi:signal transduction histidine kinase
VTYAGIRYHASLLDAEKAEQVSLNGRLKLTASELSFALERLEDTNVALAEAGRQKSRFLASMSHELRTPLNAIIGYSEMLEEEAAELGQPSFSQDLQKIHISGRHLLGLIDNVLDLSKIEAGRMQVFAERQDVAELIRGVVAVAEPLTRKNGNRLVVDADGALGSLDTDVTKVRQVLLNLLSNSAKFTERGSITLGATATPDGASVTFFVRDTGIGMTPEQLGRIFEEFSQAEAGTYRNFGGTGLGLAVSRRLAHILGGDISVESAPNTGSTFRFILPREVPTLERAGA